MQSLHLISQGVQGKTFPHVSAYLRPHEHSKYRPSFMRMIAYMIVDLMGHTVR